MDGLIQQKRPPTSVIKLIESVGILLDIPLTKKKSLYKATIPSNYDDTLNFLHASDLNAIVMQLSQLQSSEISNEKALLFYNTILQPEFDYESSINFGGLIIRDLYNLVLLILWKLQSDKQRVPLFIHNFLVIIDGTRSSYVALDEASHHCKNGTMYILVLPSNLDTEEVDGNASNHHYLKHDVQRRCQSHYKLSSHQYEIHDFDDLCQLIHSIQPNIQSMYDMIQCYSQYYHCQTMAVGIMDQYQYHLHDDMLLSQWAMKSYAGDILYTKGLSFVRSFQEIIPIKTFILYIDLYLPNTSSYMLIYLKALTYFRPQDRLIIVTMVHHPTPIGDTRELRYDFGSRQQWLQSPELLKQLPLKNEWNKSFVEAYEQEMKQAIEQSLLSGSLDTIYCPEGQFETCKKTSLLLEKAKEYQAHGIFMSHLHHEEMICELIQENTYPLLILK